MLHIVFRASRIARVAAVALPVVLCSPCALHAQQGAESASNTSVSSPLTSHTGTARIRAAVATHALARGAVLRSEDFAFVDTTIVWRWSMPPVDTLRVAAGWVAHRAISPGEVLRPPSVQPPAIITSGETVKVIWQDGSVRLVLSGVALNTAALNAPVGVRIDRSRRLDGVAIAPNTVRIR